MLLKCKNVKLLNRFHCCVNLALVCMLNLSPFLICSTQTSTDCTSQEDISLLISVITHERNHWSKLFWIINHYILKGHSIYHCTFKWLRLWVSVKLQHHWILHFPICNFSFNPSCFECSVLSVSSLCKWRLNPTLLFFSTTESFSRDTQNMMQLTK